VHRVPIGGHAFGEARRYRVRRRTIQHYAELAGVDFHGTPVEVVEGADDVAYLDFQGAVARTDSLGVQLGPAAFQDEKPWCERRITKSATN
jgi:hypothetical protein